MLIGDDFPARESITSKDFYRLAQLFADEKVERIDSILKRYHKRYHFHGAVLVSAHGKPIYKGAVGKADFRKNQKLTTETPFQIASISKQFTAMSVMMLKEDGKLSLDDKVVDYFPHFPYERIDIQMLLNHTAGLPNYMWLIEHKWKKNRVPYNDDMINLLAEHDLPLYFWPGTRFNYSNTNYAVLAAVVEKAAGQRFDKYVEQNIFEPLEMNNSFVYSRALDSASHGGKLLGFRKYWQGFRLIPENMHDGVVGDKGVYSTVEDLHKWDQGLYENKLVSKELKHQAFTKGKVRNGLSIPYGFGFRLKVREGKKIVYHNGLWSGFRTSLIRHIEDTVTVIVLNHTNSKVKSNVVQKLESIIEQPSSYDKTQDLVEAAVRQDVDSAIEQYYRWKQESSSLSVSKSKLKEAAELFEQLNKPRAAARINRLYLKISDTINTGKTNANLTGITS